MAIRLQCPNSACGVRFEVPEFYAGQKTRCAVCQTVVNVPAPAGEVASVGRAPTRIRSIFIAVVCGAMALVALALVVWRAQRSEGELALLGAQLQSAQARLTQAEARAGQATAMAEQQKKQAADAEKRRFELEATLRAERQIAESLHGQIEELQSALAEAQQREARLLANLKIITEEARARDREWKEALHRLQEMASSKIAAAPPAVATAPAMEMAPWEGRERSEPPSPAAPLPAPDIVDRQFMAVEEILKRFDQNAEAAEKEYKQQWLVLSGAVAQILETPGGRPYFLLVPWDMVRGYRGPLRCRCYAAPGREREWDRLAIGERVFALGRVGGLFPPNIIYVLDCALVDREAAGRELSRQEKVRRATPASEEND